MCTCGQEKRSSESKTRATVVVVPNVVPNVAPNGPVAFYVAPVETVLL